MGLPTLQNGRRMRLPAFGPPCLWVPVCGAAVGYTCTVHYIGESDDDPPAAPVLPCSHIPWNRKTRNRLVDPRTRPSDRDRTLTKQWREGPNLRVVGSEVLGG